MEDSFPYFDVFNRVRYEVDGGREGQKVEIVRSHSSIYRSKFAVDRPLGRHRAKSPRYRVNLKGDQEVGIPATGDICCLI